MSTPDRLSVINSRLTSFGPMRFPDALPWLVLAAAMRVVAFGGGFVALPAIFVATVAVLHAFISATRRSIEASGGQTVLNDLTLREEFQLSLRILGRIGALMLGASLILSRLFAELGQANMMGGIDGMAFDQWTLLGKPWSAIIAALVLLMIVDAGSRNGHVSLVNALREFVQRWRWLSVAILALSIAYIGLSFVQGLVRDAIWAFWQTSGASQLIKNLIYFVFIFGFAMLRLWMTLLILVWGLKTSYTRGEPTVSTARVERVVSPSAPVRRSSLK